MKPNAKRYLISIGVGLMLAFVIMVSMGIFTETQMNRVLIILSDAFFVSGMCLTCVGALVFATNEGVFRMLSYSISLFFRIRTQDGKKKKYKDYYEYKTAKEEKKGSFAYLLLVGIAFIGVACILLIWIQGV